MYLLNIYVTTHYLLLLTLHMSIFTSFFRPFHPHFSIYRFQRSKLVMCNPVEYSNQNYYYLIFYIMCITQAFPIPYYIYLYHSLLIIHYFQLSRINHRYYTFSHIPTPKLLHTFFSYSIFTKYIYNHKPSSIKINTYNKVDLTLKLVSTNI